MNRPLLTACLAALALVAGPAAAQETKHVRSLAATCANCHGTDGHAVPGATMPPLAGQPKESIVQRFKEYRSGTRPATVMHQIAKGYSDAQVEALAAYFAAQK